MKNPENRLINIDSLRGFSALSVLWFHLTNTVNNYPTSQLIRDSGAIGWIGVDIFFVISGFIIPYSLWRAEFVISKHWRTFLYKRLLRIEPTYIVSIIFTICIGLSVNAMYGKHLYNYDAGQIAAHFLYLNAFLGYEWVNPVYWTLAIEFQYYILIGLLYPVLLSQHGRVLLIFCAFLMAYLVIDSNLIFRYSGLFLIGIFAFLFHTKKLTNLEFVVFYSSSLALSLISLGVVPTLAGLSTGLFILFVRLPEFRLVTAFGMISYSVYLFHYPIVEKVVRYGKVLGFGLSDQIIVSVITLAASLFVATFFYKVVERPTMSMSSRIKYR